jgi:acyl-coenzyme A thioesterase PaaI-like protein
MMPHTHKLPNSRFCFACGLENDRGLKLTFYDNGDGAAVGSYSIPKEFESYPGVAHGGIVATILDEALIRALILKDHNRLFFTAKLTTRIRRHVPVESELKIKAWILSDRGQTAEAEAKIFNNSGTILAEARGLMMAVSEEELQSMDLEELGWKVYPDTEVQA